MSALLDLFRLWDNPVFLRFRRSQLRFKASIAWLLLTLIITSFVISVGYVVQTNFGDRNGIDMAETTARGLWIPLLIIQGLIMLLKGTAKTASGLIQDKLDQTLDYQRLTPVPPLRNLIGYLFGLPLLEYVMFALTLPHLAFIVIKGNIPLVDVVQVYLAFLVCTLFYHSTAIAIGMVMKRWILGYLFSIFSVAFLNLILAPLGSQLGLKFLQYLSVFPAIGQIVIPLQQNQFSPPAGGNPFISFADAVPFFDWTLSPFLFTLLLQFSLIATFATMAVRRWQKADKHSLSKAYALGMLAVLIVLIIGNIWPIITRQYLPYQIMGMISLDQLADTIAVALPLIYSFAVWLLCVFLFTNTIPSHDDYLRGVRRARKLNRRAARPWDDDSAQLGFMSLFVVLALIGYWIIDHEIGAAGYKDFLFASDYSALRVPLVLGLALACTALLIQACGDRGAVLVFLLVWLVPVLIAIVSGAAMEEFTAFQSIVASLSPIATLLMAGLLPLATAVQSAPEAEVAAVLTGYRSGTLMLVVQILLLAGLWQRKRRQLTSF